MRNTNTPLMLRWCIASQAQGPLYPNKFRFHGEGLWVTYFSMSLPNRFSFIDYDSVLRDNFSWYENHDSLNHHGRDSLNHRCNQSSHFQNLYKTFQYGQYK